MIRIGETLRRERQRQGLTYEQVEAELRIRTHYLRKIEDGRLDALPGAAYARGFVREYANFLGLDGSDFNAGQMGDAPDIVEGEGHGMGSLAGHALQMTCLRWQ